MNDDAFLLPLAGTPAFNPDSLFSDSAHGAASLHAGPVTFDKGLRSVGGDAALMNPFDSHPVDGKSPSNDAGPAFFDQGLWSVGGDASLMNPFDSHPVDGQSPSSGAGALMNEDYYPDFLCADEPESQFMETCIYDDQSELNDLRTFTEMSDEAARVLLTMFPSCVQVVNQQGLDDIALQIALKSNYKVKQIFRITNTAREEMHGCFKACYNISNERMVMHGTSEDAAKCIVKTGFRAAAGQRSKYGRGVYSTSDEWQALAYAKPNDRDWTQTVLVSSLLVGPSKLGKECMIDYGDDDQGRQILTATNEDRTIFCASHEEQMLAQYRVTVRFQVQVKPTDEHKRVVKIHHPSIFEAFIKRRMSHVSAALVAPVPSVQWTAVDSWLGIAKGTKVVVKTPPESSGNLLKFTVGRSGTVVGILSEQPAKLLNASYFVELHDSSFALTGPIERFYCTSSGKRLPGQQGNWLCLHYNQLTPVEDIQQYRDLKVGDNVTITSTFKMHAFCTGKTAVIKKMVKYRGVHPHILVEAHDTSITRQVMKLNKTVILKCGQESEWLSLSPFNVELVTTALVESQPQEKPPAVKRKKGQDKAPSSHDNSKRCRGEGFSSSDSTPPSDALRASGLMYGSAGSSGSS
tara:strand:- start:8338 stop:10236 length:1899 start_codon:yes stop_codon:yes gene_type:complete